MSRTGRRDTEPELELRRHLHALGLRFRVDRPVLLDRRRRVDVAFGPSRVAVLVDGCFWHGCPIHGTLPATNRAYWEEKLATNRARDQDTDSRLEESGWQVVRVWEHEDMAIAARRIATIVERRRPRGNRPVDREGSAR